MSQPGLLPRRWRETPEAAAHAQAIVHVLDTPPVRSRPDGVACIARIGTADVLPFLVAAKSLWRHLGRGRFAVIASRSVTGADRAILAHHLDDPEFAADAVAAFPDGLDWPAVSTALARRRGEYWLVISPALVATGALPEVEASIASNRSFALGARPGALIGLAAGGPGPLDPARFAAALGDTHAHTAAQQELLLARESDPLDLSGAAGLAHFAGAARHGDRCREVSRAAIAALG